MAYLMFIFSLLLATVLILSTNGETTSFMKASDSKGQPFRDGFGVVSPGESITIECKKNNDREIAWTRRNVEGSKVETLTNNDKITISNDKITIKNISFEDASVYYCDQSGQASRFYLNVYAITRSTNGTAPLIQIIHEINGITFTQLKINEKSSANVSCVCDAGSKTSAVNINWKGGEYTKTSGKYSNDDTIIKNEKTNTLTLKKPENNKALYGEYTCSCNILTGILKAKKVYIEAPPIFEDIESSVRTTEGLNVTLTCKVWGYPSVMNQDIHWRFQNDTVFRDGIKISTNESGYSQLFIPSATQNDRGLYTCHASNSVGSNTAGTMIRVKGRYAALWPFIGIVIQVIILAAIIIVYEWKKSHKPQDNSKFISESKNDTVVTARSQEPTDVRQRLMKE